MKKNIESPYDLGIVSKKYVWWKCKEGHSWMASPRNRCQGSQCPECRIKTSNTSFPEQAILFYIRKFFPQTQSKIKSILLNKRFELDIYIPEINVAIEYDGVYWHTNIKKEQEKNLACQEKNITLYRIRERGLPHSPNCINIFRKENNTNQSLTEVIKTLVNYLCVDIDVDVDRDILEIKSTYKASIKGYSLASKFPDLAREWHPTKNKSLSADTIPSGSRLKVWWICPLKHEYLMEIDKRTSQHNNCPYCAGKRVLIGFNDFESQCPELSKEWHPTKNNPLLPSMITKGSSKKVWWLGQCGHEWKSTVCSRTGKGEGCPVCGGQKIIKGENDLITLCPNVMLDWDSEKNTNLNPTSVGINSSKIAYWKCHICGYKWSSRIISKTHTSVGCRKCATKIIGESRKIPVYQYDLEGNFIAKYDSATDTCRINGWKALYPILQCCHGDTRTSNGYRWSFEFKKEGLGPMPNNYRSRLKPGTNDLKTCIPELVPLWHPTKNGELTPENIHKGSRIKVWWLGECGHEWQSTIGNIQKRRKKEKCPYCSNEQLLVGFNDLASRCPELVGQWHPTKNGILTPSTVKFNSSSDIWWQCEKGHSYQAKILNKMRNLTKCPLCSNCEESSKDN